MFNVPVLIILYNRVEETHNVFQVLRTVQPTQLYVAGDGAKNGDPEDRKLTYRTQSVIQPDWPCQVHTHFREDHAGRTKMIYEAIRWFFSQEEEGIILFEDTVPHYDFFPFCETLLSQYRNNEQIFSINGSYLRRRSRKKYKKRMRKGESSYYFSAYSTSWGFATWRNRWNDFSLSMEKYTHKQIVQIVEPYMTKQRQKAYWINRFGMLRRLKANHWSYQYLLHIWAHEGLCITPYLNLVTNIGFTKQEHRKVRRLRRNAYPIMPITHPSTIEQNKKEDRYMFKHIFNRAFMHLFQDWIKSYGQKEIPTDSLT